jgi:hypothetical protein
MAPMAPAVYAAVQGWTDMPAKRSGSLHKIKNMGILGLDLAASPRRPTGFCVLRGRRVTVGHLFGDEEIFTTVDTAIGSACWAMLPAEYLCLCRHDAFSCV